MSITARLNPRRLYLKHVGNAIACRVDSAAGVYLDLLVRLAREPSPEVVAAYAAAHAAIYANVEKWFGPEGRHALLERLHEEHTGDRFLAPDYLGEENVWDQICGRADRRSGDR